MSETIIIQETDKFRVEGSFSGKGDTQTYEFELYTYNCVNADLNGSECLAVVEKIEVSPLGATWHFENDAITEDDIIPDFSEFKTKFDVGTPENVLEVYNRFSAIPHEREILLEEPEEYC